MSTAADLLPMFRTRFPEFTSVADDRITLYIEDALVIFSGCKTATQYLAAHLLTLDNESGVGVGGGSVDGGDGEVSAESVGAESISLKTQADTGTDVFYTTTPYGRRFLALKKACPRYVFSVLVR